jgi:hypothetical protein
MKAKEHQEVFNMKLMKILNKIDKKLDKENGSIKSGIHKSPDDKRISRSVRKHHHHPQKHSHRISQNSSSSSPIRNHRRYGVD